MSEEKWMRIALAEAEAAGEAGEIPVGAAVVRGEELLAQAGNRRERDHDPTAHAELLALREAARVLGDWRLRGCTLYVTLEPCPMCAGAMVMSQLDRCVYGAADPQRGCCGSVYDLPADPALQGRTRWEAGALAEDCKALLDRFWLTRR